MRYMYIQVYVIDVDRKKKEDFLRHTVMLFENNFFLLISALFLFSNSRRIDIAVGLFSVSLSNICLIAALHANTSTCFFFSNKILYTYFYFISF